MAIVDIFLMVGGNSGFEIALNRTADYLSMHGCKIRFLQIIKTGYNWATPNASFTCFDMGNNINIAECQNIYYDFILKNGKPNIIFATGIPALAYISKLTLSALSISDCPIVAWPHNDISSYDSNIINTKNFIDYADIAYAISDKIADDISRLCPGKLIYRVNNTISLDSIHYSENRNSNKLAFVGRLSEEKKVSLILTALSQCKSDWTLSILGEGPEKNNLEALSHNLHLEKRVSFYGWLDNPWETISDHRALLLASTDMFEGSPLTCIEALANGMPVISTPVATIPEIISQGINGYIYNFDAPTELANILDKMSSETFCPQTAVVCRNSVIDFMPHVALWDFLCKTIASSKLIGLPQRHWQDKRNRLVKDKISVIINDSNTTPENLESFLNSLSDQTIEPENTEIIIVHSNKSASIKHLLNEFESKKTEQVIIIDCDEAPSKEEAYNIAMQYASGDMYLSLDPEKDRLSPDFIENKYMEQLCLKKT